MKKEYIKPELEILELNEDIMADSWTESIRDPYEGAETPGFGTY